MRNANTRPCTRHGAFPLSRRMPAITIALALLGANLSGLALAADAPADTDGKDATAKAGSLEPILVTGDRDPQVAPSTAYVESVITSETIANLSPGAASTAQTMLGAEPSIFVYTNGPLGVETSIYFRAFNSGQFSETYDGISFNDVFNGGVTGQAENRNNVLITPNNMGSVQLYRGINNPSVNSYNSLGGTINFNPRTPTATFGGEAGVSYGSFGTFGWHGTVNTGDVGGLRQIISIEQAGSRGWINDTGDYNNNLYWGATFKAGPDVDLTNYFLANSNRGEAVYNMPLPLLDQYGTTFQWPRNWTNSQLHDTNVLEIFGAKWRASATVVVENKAFFSRNEYLRTSFSNPLYQASQNPPYTQPYFLEDSPQQGTGTGFWVGLPYGPTYDPTAVFGSLSGGTDFHFYGYTATAVGDTPTVTLNLDNNEVTIGGNLTHGRLHSREYWYGSEPVPQITGYNDAWDEHDSRTLASVYAQDVVALMDGRLHLTPGVKYVHANTSDNDSVGFFYSQAGSVGDSEHFVSPTFGANYAVDDKLNVFGAFGKNTKLPDISSYYNSIEYPNFQVNAVVVQPQLKPEHVDDFELGLRYRNGSYSAEVNAYKENFRDTFISSTNPVTNLTLYQNGGSSVYQGFEAQVMDKFEHLPIPGRIEAYLNLARNQARFTSTFNSDYTGGNGINGSKVLAGTPLAGVPQNLISAGATWKSDGWRANAEGRFIGRQYLDQTYSGTPSSAVIGGHMVVNLGLSRLFVLGAGSGNQTLRVGLNVDNVFDRRYLNTGFTDTDAAGNNFVRGIYAAPRAVSGNVVYAF